MFTSIFNKDKTHLLFIKIVCAFCLVMGCLGIGMAVNNSGYSNSLVAHARSTRSLSRAGDAAGQSFGSKWGKDKGGFSTPTVLNAASKSSSKSSDKSSSSKGKGAASGSDSDSGSSDSSSSDSGSDTVSSDSPFLKAAQDVATADGDLAVNAQQQLGGSQSADKAKQEYMLSDTANPGRQFSRLAAGNGGFSTSNKNESGINVKSWLNNTTSATSSDSSSGSTSVRTLQNTGSEGLAAEYELALSKLGLDHSQANGVGNSSMNIAGRHLGGALMIFAFIANYGAFFLLDFFGKFATWAQPLFWLTRFGNNPQSPLYGVAQMIKQAVYYLSQLGMIWAFLFWIVTLGLGWLGFRGLTYQGGNRVGGVARSTMIYLMKCICIIVLPLATVALSAFLMSFFEGPFTSNYDNVTEEAVDSGFINDHDWIEHSRMQLPPNMHIPSPANPGLITQHYSMTPDKILDINSEEAGMSEAKNLPRTTQRQVSQFVTDADTSDANGSSGAGHNNMFASMRNDEGALQLLIHWMQCDHYNAVDWESYAKTHMPGVNQDDKTQVNNALEDEFGNPNGQDKGGSSGGSDDSSGNQQSDSSDSSSGSSKSNADQNNAEGDKEDWPDGQNPLTSNDSAATDGSATGMSNGMDNFPYVNAADLSATNEPTSNTTQSSVGNSLRDYFYSSMNAQPEDSGDVSDQTGDEGLPANQIGGLSTIGMYNYLLMVPNSGDTVDWTSGPNQQSDMTAPIHYDVGLAGTGANGIGNYTRTLGELMSLAMLSIGLMMLAYEILIKNDFVEIKNAFKTATGSIAAGRDLLAMAALVVEQLVGIWIALKLGRALVLGAVEWVTEFATDQLGQAAAFIPAHDVLAGNTMSSSVTGAIQFFTGVGMIWFSARSVKYMRVVVGTLASGVRNSTHRWMNVANGYGGRGHSLTGHAARSAGRRAAAGGLGHFIGGGAALGLGASMGHHAGNALGAIGRAAGKVIGHSPGKGSTLRNALQGGGKDSRQKAPTISPNQARVNNSSGRKTGPGSHSKNSSNRNGRSNGQNAHSLNKQERQNQANGRPTTTPSALAAQNQGKDRNFANGGTNFNGSQASSLADNYGSMSSAVDSANASPDNSMPDHGDNDMAPLNSSNASLDSGLDNAANDLDSGINSLDGADSTNSSDASGNGLAGSPNTLNSQNSRNMRNARNARDMHDNHGMHDKHLQNRRQNAMNRHNGLANNHSNSKRNGHRVAGINQNRRSTLNNRPTRTVGGHRIGAKSTPQEIAGARKGMITARGQVMSANRAANSFHNSGSHSQIARNAINDRVNSAHQQLGGAARYATAVNMDAPISPHHSNLVNRSGVTYGRANSALKNVAAAQHRVAQTHYAVTNPTSKHSMQMLHNANRNAPKGTHVTLSNLYDNALSNYATQRNHASNLGINSHAMSSPRQTHHSLHSIQTHLTSALNAKNWDVNAI